MNELHSKWRTAELAKTFLEGVRGAIPAARLQLEVLGKIVSEWCPSPCEILDLGCGDGVLGRTLLASHPAAHVTFADFSEPMLEAAKKQIGHNQRATVVKADFTTPAWVKALGIKRPIDIIVSGFAIHHQTDNRKKELYSEIYGLLRNANWTHWIQEPGCEQPVPSLNSFLKSALFPHCLRMRHFKW